MSNNKVIPFIGEDGRYHYIYKIINKVNGKYYKGVHSTFELNDGYLGSGIALENAKNKYGKENFSIEFIKFFKNRENALQGEFEYITESDVTSDECYNLSYGGNAIAIGKVVARDKFGNIYHVDIDDIRLKTRELIVNTSNRTSVKDKDGNTMSVSVDDERLKDGTLVGVCKNMTNAQDADGNIYHISIDDERLITGELKPLFIGQFMVRDNETGEKYFVSSKDYDPLKHTSIHKNKVVVQDKNGNKFSVDCDDERFLSGELLSIHKNKHPVKDKDGNILYVNTKTDERFKSGELVSVTKGRVVVKDKDGNTYSVFVDDPRYISKELVPFSTGLVNVVDKDGNIFKTDVSDERIKTGELQYSNIGNIILRNKFTGEIKCFNKNKDTYDPNIWIFHSIGKIQILDKNGKRYDVYENDPRVSSCEYTISTDLYVICKIEDIKITKRIILSEFRKYYNDGWIYPVKTCIIYKIDNDGYITNICHKSNKEIIPFIENGWKLVKPKDEVVIMKNNKFKYVRKNQIKYHQNDGWEKIYLHHLKVEYIQQLIDGKIDLEEAKRKSTEKIEKRKNSHKKKIIADEIKKTVLIEYFLNHLTVKEICKKYNVAQTSLCRWIRNYQKIYPELGFMMSSIEN